MNSKLTNKCFEKDCTFTRAEIKLLLQYVQQSLQMPGLTKDYSLMLLDNFNILTYVGKCIDNGAPAIINKENYEACEKEFIQLLEQFGDRDDQGNLIRDEEGHIIINDQQVEFDEAKEAFMKKHEDVYNQVNLNETATDVYMNEKMTVRLVLLNNFEDYPDAIPPVILSLFERMY